MIEKCDTSGVIVEYLIYSANVGYDSWVLLTFANSGITSRLPFAECTTGVESTADSQLVIRL